MPLLNVTVKNFKQENITAEFTTSTSDNYWGAASHLNQNSLARSGLITLTPSSSSENPTSGAEGYWSFGTNNLTISGNPGATQGAWLTYGNPYNNTMAPLSVREDAYWTTGNNPLLGTEYDPGGGGDAVANFNSSSPTASLVPGVGWVTIDQTYNYKIGHDFWKYNLQGNFLGENYEPTPGEPLTYYKVWTAQETMDSYSNYSWHDQYSSKWNVGIVDKVVAVNSMPLISGAGNYWGASENLNQQAQQGNRIFVIVILKTGITGQNIVDLGETISIDLDGTPVFIDFEDPTPPQTDQEDWFDVNNSGGGDDYAWGSASDGGDADEDSGSGSIEVGELDITFSSSEDENDSNGWGNAGLTEDQYLGDEVNNTTSYNDLAATNDER